MAINPNFVFSDPALQREVVNAAQVRAAADAARAQQFAQTLAAMRQERQAASDREERRAIREGDIRRLEATEAERRRQFDVNTGLTREDIASREKISGVTRDKTDENELYRNLLSLVDVRNNPSSLPTAKELEARMVGLSEQKKQILRDERQRSFDAHRTNANLIQQEADGLNSLVGQVDKTSGKTYTLESLLKGSQFRNNLRINRQAGRLEPIFGPPRQDAGPDDGFRFYQNPGVRAAPEPIGAVQGRVNAGQPTGFWRSLIGAGSAFHPAAAFDVAARAGRALMGYPAPPPAAALSAPPGMMGSEGVLAPLDYVGPEYDYSQAQPRFAVPPPSPEEILAPPVFVPPY